MKSLTSTALWPALGWWLPVPLPIFSQDQAMKGPQGGLQRDPDVALQVSSGQPPALVGQHPEGTSAPWGPPGKPRRGPVGPQSPPPAHISQMTPSGAGMSACSCGRGWRSELVLLGPDGQDSVPLPSSLPDEGSRGPAAFCSVGSSCRPAAGRGVWGRAGRQREETPRARSSRGGGGAAGG